MPIPADIIGISQDLVENNGEIITANYITLRVAGRVLRTLISDTDAPFIVKAFVSGGRAAQPLGGSPVRQAPEDEEPPIEELGEEMRYAEAQDGQVLGVYGGDPGEPPQIPEEDPEPEAPAPPARVAPPLRRPAPRPPRQVMADEQGNPIVPNQGGVNVGDYVATGRREATAG